MFPGSFSSEVEGRQETLVKCFVSRKRRGPERRTIIHTETFKQIVYTEVEDIYGIGSIKVIVTPD